MSGIDLFNESENFVMKISATVQARMGSKRLPGKVLKPILGKPMLALQIERIKQSKLINEIIVATTTKSQDEPIAKLADNLGVNCFRGSEEDVLSRIVGALKAYHAQINVEFMADNPMPDPDIVDGIIDFYLKNKDKYDYVTNGLKTTYPPGMEVFVYSAQIIIDAEKQVRDIAMREYVGPNIYRHPDSYRIHNIEAPDYLYAPEIHLEVDTQEDFEVVSAVYEHFYPKNPKFSLVEIIEFLRNNPHLIEKNRYIERRWRAFRND